MNITSSRTIIGTVVVAALVLGVLSALFMWFGGFGPGASGIGYYPPYPAQQGAGFPGYGMMGPGMMGGGMMGGMGMMGPGFGRAYTGEPLSVDEARGAVEDYLARLGNADLAVKEVMVFNNQAYAEVMEKSTGTGAFEALVDPVTRAVYLEPGPNMMWNLKYGHMAGFGGMGMMGGYGGMGMMGGGLSPSEVSSEMPVSPDKAIQTANRFLDAYLSGTRAADEADKFYGYYTIHIMRGGEPVGMLSVNGYTQQVFVHFWHGDFVEMVEL